MCVLSVNHQPCIQLSTEVCCGALFMMLSQMIVTYQCDWLCCCPAAAVCDAGYEKDAGICKECDQGFYSTINGTCTACTGNKTTLAARIAGPESAACTGWCLLGRLMQPIGHQSLCREVDYMVNCGTHRVAVSLWLVGDPASAYLC